MAPLLLRAQQYLARLLPSAVSESAPWEAGSMPYVMQDALDLAQVTVGGNPVILAATRQATSQQTLQKLLFRLRGIAGCRVLYVAPHLSSYERKRLLAERVEFVVPDSQLFAPSLAIDLRESTTTSAAVPEVLAFGPAAQVLLLALLHSNEGTLSTLAVARNMGYSPMTASRANREMEAAGLVELSRVGSKSTITLAHERQEVWERAKPLMRSPVARQLHVIGPSEPLALAGESALAELTLLVRPSENVYAIGPNDWRSMQSEFTIRPEAEPNTFKLEVWSYHPLLQDGRSTVDPLSLILSLQDERDERVQIALEQLEKSMWQRLKD